MGISNSVEREPNLSTKKKEEKMLTRFFAKMQDEEGQGLVEYALIIVLVSVALVAALTALTGGISNAYSAAVVAITPAG